MRFQILSLLIILTFINCQNTFTFVSTTEGSCASDEYSFTVVGTVTTATSSITEWTPTLTAPADATATCSMPAVAAGGSGTITCKIISAFSESAITLTKLEATGFTAVSIPSADQEIGTDKTCDGTLNTFEYASKTEGSCENNEYSFTVTGTVTAQTTAATTWTIHSHRNSNSSNNSSHNMDSNIISSYWCYCFLFYACCCCRRKWHYNL